MLRTFKAEHRSLKDATSQLISHSHLVIAQQYSPLHNHTNSNHNFVLVHNRYQFQCPLSFNLPKTVSGIFCNGLM